MIRKKEYNRTIITTTKDINRDIILNPFKL